jgi:hypothetical protein
MCIRHCRPFHIIASVSSLLLFLVLGMGRAISRFTNPLTARPNLVAKAACFALEVKFLIHDCVLYQHMIVCATMAGWLKLKVVKHVFIPGTTPRARARVNNTVWMIGGLMVRTRYYLVPIQPRNG